MPSIRLFLAVCASVCGPFLAHAQTDNAFTTNVLFSVTHAAGSSNVFVAGGSASLGGWDVTRAPRLRHVGGNVWQGEVAMPLGTNTPYRFFRRSSASASFGDTNVTWLGAGNSTHTSAPTPAGPYTGKTVYYYSGWTNANILWRQGTNNWTSSAMTRLGPGRAANEYLYGITVGNAGWPIEFVPNNGTLWDNAFGVSGSNYLTPLDFILLQDGHVFNYWPTSAISAPQFVTNFITSSYTGNGIPSREVRVLLPRGYTQNTNKRYPVLYMHDGQNVFDPGGQYGSWSADASAIREIRMGRMRETIIVAVNNTNVRLIEYSPPTDTAPLSGGAAGTGNYYRDFIVNNVRSWVDNTFRTLNDPPNTGVMGSSMGGLISHYIGISTNTFGLMGVMSPSFTYAPNWVTSVNASPKPQGRLFYLDTGTVNDAWDPYWNMLNIMNSKGFSFGDDFYYLVGVGAAHNEAAWAARLPLAFRYLYDIRRERNAITVAAFPPSIEPPAVSVSNTTRAISLSFPTLGGVTYNLQRTTNLQTPVWSNVATFTPGTPWGTTDFTDSVPASDPQYFYRLEAASPLP